MTVKTGYFDAFVNGKAARPGAPEKALMARIDTVVKATIPRSQLHWAGSQRKGTAIIGSDLDICVASPEPVTEALRRTLRSQLEAAIGRPTTIRSHVVRVAPGDGLQRLDLAFANAAFVNRPLPELALFEGKAGRQMAARALKLWTRSGGMPHVGGWVWEALVVHLAPNAVLGGYPLFDKTVSWLRDAATPAALEGVLRHANQGAWNPAWSSRVPGNLQALKNHAIALGRRSPKPEDWSCTDDAGRWLCP